MRAAWHDLWGCGRGPANALAPQVRIASGAGVFTACMVAPTTLAGAVLAATFACGWLWACSPPAKVVGAALLAGLTALLPYSILMILSAQPWASAAGMLVRGMSGLFVSISTVSAVSIGDLRDGLVRLPVPGAVSAILVQTVHQTATLAYETKRVAAAMSVRAASAGRFTLWRLLASLPQVWLPRIVGRADRVAAAMEVRGFCEAGHESATPGSIRWTDRIAVAAVVLALAVALVFRRSVR
jgi:energy-coupling factor transporter transmembrane protein EcfT